jgi:hypothetical protein
MISITSYLHHEELKNLIRRWMYYQALPSDAGDINRLVHFNNAFVSRYLPVFAEQMFGQLHARPFLARKSRRKADLKDAIVINCPEHNARIDQMLIDYRTDPGLFYRETPFHGMLYFAQGADGPFLIGSSRIKRVRRLGEKIARRIIDAIFDSIRNRADLLAQDRAARVGVPVAALITPPAQMVEEFQRAESRLLEDLKLARPILTQEQLVIQDVAGIKVLVEDHRRDDFLARVAGLDRCELIEVEAHRGRYNAVNLIVRYRPDKATLVAQPPSSRLIGLMGRRGMAPAEVHQRFEEFVVKAEDHVHIEVIVCNYQEMLESEIGRCMHEDRILQQRLTQQYNGQLARNIEFLIAYLFAFAASARMDLGELPIRLWDRYLPDYFDEVVMGLYEMPRLEVME